MVISEGRKWVTCILINAKNKINTISYFINGGRVFHHDNLSPAIPVALFRHHALSLNVRQKVNKTQSCPLARYVSYAFLDTSVFSLLGMIFAKYLPNKSSLYSLEIHPIFSNS